MLVLNLDMMQYDMQSPANKSIVATLEATNIESGEIAKFCIRYNRTCQYELFVEGHKLLGDMDMRTHHNLHAAMIDMMSEVVAYMLDV